MYNQTQPSSSGTTATARLLSTPFIVVATFFVSLLIIVSLLTLPSRPPLNRPDPSLFPNRHPRLHRVLIPGHQSSPPPSPPSIAYFISGSAGDSDRILRLLYAVYHPRNHYLLHLDRSAPQADRDYLALAINAVPLFRAARNVYVTGNANFVYSKGSSSISSLLHGASILLRILKSWIGSSIYLVLITHLSPRMIFFTFCHIFQRSSILSITQAILDGENLRS